MRKIIKYFCILVVVFFVSCRIDADEEFDAVEYAGQGETDMFMLSDENGVTYRPFFVRKNTIHIVVPHEANLISLVPKFTYGETITQINGVEQMAEVAGVDFSDFLSPVELTVATVAEESKTYTVLLYDLPVLWIDTPEEQAVESKTVRVEHCTVKLAMADGSIFNLGTAGIKVRGNSTALLPKKPYNVKFDKKRSILGMKKSKKWVLLANAYYDRTQLHNTVAFEIARMTDYVWVQSGEFVEVILNGEHRGLYYLCEKVDIEEGKIDIEEIAPTDIESYSITGGYLLEGNATNEVGNFPDDGLSFATDYFNVTGTKPWGLYWFLKNPDTDVPERQLEYIKNQMNTLECLVSDIGADNYINDGGGYRNYLDIESAINWWLVEELCLNEEASRTKNCYLYKKRGDEKLYFGPPWDFDAWSFGFTGTKKFYVKPYTWLFSDLFKDAEFVSRVKEKWALYKTVWEEKIPVFIHEEYVKIHRAAERNERMWADWHSVNSYPSKSYHMLITEMEAAFVEQLEWMDAEIKKM